jgi:hypothetical protein
MVLCQEEAMSKEKQVVINNMAHLRSALWHRDNKLTTDDYEIIESVLSNLYLAGYNDAMIEQIQWLKKRNEEAVIAMSAST